MQWRVNSELLKVALLLTETELQSHEHPKVAFLGDALWVCAGTQKVWSNTWPCTAMLPKDTVSLDIAGPVLHGKHPGIRTPSLDPKGSNLLPVSKGLDEKEVNNGTLTPQSRAPRSPWGWY